MCYLQRPIARISFHRMRYNKIKLNDLTKNIGHKYREKIFFSNSDTDRYLPHY